jgi:hypothetical protein
MSEAETTFRKMSEVRPRDRVAAAVTGPYREGTLTALDTGFKRRGRPRSAPSR